MNSSEGVKNYANEKVSKLQKYLRAPLEADLIFSTERHFHRVDVTIGADGNRYAGHEESEDMYASIDLVMDKIDRQVRDAKNAMTTRKRHSPSIGEIARREED